MNQINRFKIGDLVRHRDYTHFFGRILWLSVWADRYYIERGDNNLYSGYEDGSDLILCSEFYYQSSISLVNIEKNHDSEI